MKCLLVSTVNVGSKCIFRISLQNKPKTCLTDTRHGYFFNAYLYAGKSTDDSQLEENKQSAKCEI
jgi:hypothetical protein